MKSLVLILVILFLISGSGFSQPILGSTPDGDIEFCVLTINGEEDEPIDVFEEYDWIFFEDLFWFDFPDGVHVIELRCGNPLEESDDIMFYLKVISYDETRYFEIVPDPENKDPRYLAKFDPEKAVAEITNGVTVIKPRPPEEEDEEDNGSSGGGSENGGGGGGGGCFITTSAK